jgi:putative DNA primase/helicase
MMERPEERTDYAIKDLIAWCREQHPRMVAAALIVLRAYVVAGRPSQSLAGWGSFEAWRDLIASAMVWAGGSDVMSCRPTIAGQDDPETGALRILLEHFPREGCTVGGLLKRLYDFRGPGGADEALREALETLAPPRPGQAPSAQRVGTVLNKHRARVVDGRWIERAGTDRSNVTQWVVRGTAK